MSNLDPGAFCWYSSETQLGLMYVGVQTSEAEQANLQGPHSVFQQAALLSNTEAMIQAIELWQEIDLDLVPCGAPDSTSLHLSLQLNDNDNASPAVVMVFDCATLVQLKSLSPELKSVVNVTSSNVDLRVQLDRLSISSEELAMIEDGAVVIIPAAYQPEWGVVAISATPEVPLRFGGRVEKGDQALQVQIAHHEANTSDVAAGADRPSDDSVTVWCKQMCTIPVKELLGIDAGEQSAQLISLDARELKLVQGESTIAHGSMLSYGRGSVMAVSERLMD